MSAGISLLKKNHLPAASSPSGWELPLGASAVFSEPKMELFDALDEASAVGWGDESLMDTLWSGLPSGTSTSSASMSPASGMSDEIGLSSPNAIIPDLPDDLLANLDDHFIGLSHGHDAFNLLKDLDLESLGQSLPTEETVKADLMWSSTVSGHARRHGQRHRDVSLTLSECAEALFKDVDLLGSSPPLIGISPESALGLKVADQASTTDMEEDEEVDVVSDDNASTVSAYSSGSNSQRSSPRAFNVQAGRSLLRSRQPPSSVPLTPTPGDGPSLIDHMNGDHCYFQVRPPVSPSTNGGILTPSESSDDEELAHKMGVTQTRHSTGVRSRTASVSDNVKFKFRMKFQSHSPQRRSLLALNTNRHHLKRKSAVNNAHCPAAGSDEETESTSLIEASPHGSPSLPAPSKKARIHSGGSVSSTGGSGTGSDQQKCREIRDLHNSMERQRRVDLRNNFDQLKDVVPELAEIEKASKLNILNKSSEYCRTLTFADVRLRREREAVQARSLALQKKLAQLVGSYPSRQAHTPGRISVLSRH
eukprot:snap_masked-scaffold97_size377342-processed-gene-1.12 protein:Tk12115 transcript:snap_masked-scaffold97_size377342-processed-gene-1.12-mRNA-1 annotation:"unnamed protein product"